MKKSLPIGLSDFNTILSHKDATYGSFVAKKVTPIEELGCTLREIVHVPSGAEILHIENNDPENLFCLSFKTLPKDSKGAAHILEHTVLCGSKKFPVKDPFFAMTRRSLNTFMNALTGSDFTCYPAASQVEKDFYNLLEVYLDAVFHPEIKHLSFLQEGHRLEYTNGNLEWKGIVFNEMKGANASPEARLWHEMMAALTPDLTYAFVSGGDPKEIPKLSYEELKEFHKTFYHPSRCLFFFYGNFPLKHHLDFIEKRALLGIEKKKAIPPEPLQTRFTTPVIKESFYPVSETEGLEKRAIISFGFLTTPLSDQESVLALLVLDAILMENDASLLKFPLLQSGLCVTADAYIDTDMAQIPYVIACKGCRASDADALGALLQGELEKICRDGIPSELIESALHQLELGRTEIGGEGAPFGLTLFMRAALLKQHGCNPENALRTHSLFNSLLQKAKDPCFFPNLIRKYFLDMPHTVRLTLHPDPDLTARELQEEKLRLKKIEESLKPDQVAAILEEGKKLLAYQQETEGESLECLPKVTLKDVPVLVRSYPLTQTQNVYHHATFTNHFVYPTLVFDLPHLTEEELPYAQLFTQLLPELGAEDLGYKEMQNALQAHTGGISASLSLYAQAHDPLTLRPAFSLRAKGLVRKSKELFTLMKKMVLAPRLEDEKRLEELILQLHTAMQNKLNRNGLRYASQLALSGFSLSTKIANQWYGLPFFKLIQEIATQIPKEGVKELVKKLEHVKAKVLSYHRSELIVSSDETTQAELKSSNYFDLLELPERPFNPWQPSGKLQLPLSQARPIASAVAFTCRAYKVAHYTHPHAPALAIASHLLDNTVLHKKIREQGGAYGGGTTYTPSTGTFTFHAYRDPHISSTLQSFDEALESVEKGKFDESDLESAKLGVVQQLDSPLAPGSRALASYALLREGRSDKERQRYRDALLALTAQEVQTAVKKEFDKSPVTVTFAGKELLEKELTQKELPIIPLFS